MIDLKLGAAIEVDYDLPQTSLQLAYPGVKRDAPDFFAACADERDPRRRHLHLAPVRRGARKARAGLQRRFFAWSTRNTPPRWSSARRHVRTGRPRRWASSATWSSALAEEGPTEAELAATKKYIDRRLCHQQSGFVRAPSPRRWSSCSSTISASTTCSGAPA